MMEDNSEIVTNGEQPEVLENQASAVQEKKHSSFSKLLNRYFHHIDRGGTLGGEIGAGITMMILSVCSIFLTMQVIANAQGAGSLFAGESGDFYATTYLAAILVSFIGTLVVGIVARLPFVQTSSLSLTVMMISMVGAGSGLTYYNVLFISFLSSIIYAVIVSVPVVKKYVFQALPASIRKILPAISGAIIILLALQTLGLFGIGDVLVSVPGNAPTEYSWGGILHLPQILTGYGDSASYGAMYAGLLAGAVAIIIYALMKSFKVKHPVGWALLLGTLIYFCIAAITDINIVIGWARLWLIGSEDTLQTHVGNAFSEVFSSIGKVFSADGGLDFSNYEGSVFGLIAGGLVCFLMLSTYDCQSTLQATSEKVGFNAEDVNDIWLAQTCNAGLGVVSALFGTTPVSLGKESVAGADDNAKSGIASIVAAIGLLISAFVWIIPGVMATYVNLNIAFANGEYGHYDMGSLQMTLYCTFGVADAVMIALGLKMMKCLGNIDYSDVKEWMPAVIALVFSVAFTNLAYGVALGVIAYAILKLAAFKKEGSTLSVSFKENFVANLKTFPVPTAVLTLLSIVMVITLMV